MRDRYIGNHITLYRQSCRSHGPPWLFNSGCYRVDKYTEDGLMYHDKLVIHE